MNALRWVMRRRPGLVSRFALASLVAFVGLGIALSVIVSKQFISRQEAAAQFHAGFVANSVLRYRLGPQDLRHPLTGPKYRALNRFVARRILRFPVKRVKIWNLHGTVVYSDRRALVGRHFPGEPDREARRGEMASEVTNLDDPENVYERGLAAKLYSSYVPLYLHPRHHGKRPDAVVELYQDYNSIQVQANQLFHSTLISLAVGLLLLYVLLLPILLRASRVVRKQNDQLEEQARDLSVLLAREQDTVVDLRRLNQMKSDFVAVASHELRTPLTAILGYVKTLQRPEFESDPTARREFLQAIERQGDRLHRLITNLLTAAHLENREAVLKEDVFDFASLAQEVREGFHDSSPRIQLNIPQDLPPIESDRVRVGEIVANLVDNALKYSPDNAVVHVGIEEREGQLRLWVRDEGVGIPPEDLDRIFDRFYQSDQSATRRFGGVGLGLHVVKELTVTLGGRISVESVHGIGTTFTVTLPLRRGLRQRAAAEADTRGRSEGPRTPAQV